MKEHLLIIDDDETLGQLLASSLRPRGFEVTCTQGGLEGIRKTFEIHPDVVILDVMMPEMDGWETCRRLREITDIPIIMLTAKAQQQNIIQGFQLGVDDYLTKPFNVLELEYRIRAILRRTEQPERKSAANYDDGHLKVDLERRQVMLDNQVIHLTPTEFRLLSYMVRHKGHVLPHKHLLAEVWGSSYQDATECLSLYVRYLREKLEKEPSAPEYIRTEWGRGYWFAPRT
jgi:two-component system KDP operon response regulator KdpE